MEWYLLSLGTHKNCINNFGVIVLKNIIQATLAVITLSTAFSTSAEIILASDFTGTSGDPTNISWTENSIEVTNTLDPQTTSFWENLVSLHIFWGKILLSKTTF